MSEKNKILVILGPTATGKSELAVKIAKKYNGEIISADSRQVYKGLNIGTGKITKKEMEGITHYMLDVISPKKTFSVSDWKKQTEKIIDDIISQKKLPIICGGTGFYIQSIVESLVLPEVPPNRQLRKRLEKNSLEELQKTLAKLDPRRFSIIDIKNPVRLIRAIEIATKLGNVPTIVQARRKNSYEFLQIGLTIPAKDLKLKIHNRVLARIKKGMIKEARNLYNSGLSWKRMRELGLEYKYLADYIENRNPKKELIKNIEKGNLDYAKRQITWFKRDKRIRWFRPNQRKEIQKEIDLFLA